MSEVKKQSVQKLEMHRVHRISMKYSCWLKAHGHEQVYFLSFEMGRITQGSNSKICKYKKAVVHSECTNELTDL